MNTSPSDIRAVNYDPTTAAARLRVDVLLTAAFLAVLIVLYIIRGPGQDIYGRPGALFFDYFFNGNSDEIDLGFRPPLYPFIIAVMQLIAGSEPDAYGRLAIGLNIICMTLSFFLFLRILDMSGYRSARYLLLPLTLLLPGQVTETFVVRETSVYTLMLAYVGYRAARGLNDWDVLQLGVLAGLAGLHRPSGYLLIIIVPLLFFVARRDVFPSLVRIAAFLAVFVATVLPWQMTFSQDVGRPMYLSSCTSGIILHKAHGPSFINFYLYEDVDNGKETFPVPDDVTHFCEVNDAAKADAQRALLENLRENPVDFVLENLTKTVVFAGGAAPFGDSKVTVNADGMNERSDFEFRLTHLLYNAAGLAFFTMFLLGLAFCTRAPASIRIFGFLLIFGHMAAHVLTWPEMRFKFPLDFVILSFAAMLLASLWQKARDDADFD